MVEEVTVYNMTDEDVEAAKSAGLSVDVCNASERCYVISGLQWEVEEFLNNNNLKGN